MGSSGGDDGGGAGLMAMLQQGKPLGGLPIAGSGANVDPYNYGKFQNFLPDIKAEGQNDMATGLRPSMFEYKGPDGKVAGGGGGAAAAAVSGGDVGGATSNEIGDLRQQLAMLAARGGGSQPRVGYPWGQNGPDVYS